MSRLVSVRMPEAYIEGLDQLTHRFGSRSDAIRVAVGILIGKHEEMKQTETKYHFIFETKIPLCKRPYKF